MAWRLNVHTIRVGLTPRPPAVVMRADRAVRMPAVPPQPPYRQLAGATAAGTSTEPADERHRRAHADARAPLARALLDMSTRRGEIVVTSLLLVALVAVSLLIRTRALDAPFWIDEGLSVGIASHPFSEIFDALAKDGSPPLYYLLLHFWMEAFGRSEADTHVLSLLFALLTIPSALWAGWTLFGRRGGLHRRGARRAQPVPGSPTRRRRGCTRCWCSCACWRRRASRWRSCGASAAT